MYCNIIYSQLDDGHDLTTESYDHMDSRPWTQEHFVAANIHPNPSMLALTPPQGDDIRDVDVRGPGTCYIFNSAKYCENLDNMVHVVKLIDQ